jgi:hypothetical protein
MLYRLLMKRLNALPKTLPLRLIRQTRGERTRDGLSCLLC